MDILRYTLSKGKGWERARAPDNLKVLRAKATGPGDSWGSPRVLGREVSGGSEAPYLHLLSHKPAQALMGLQEGRLDPCPLSCQSRQRAHLRQGQTLTDSDSYILVCVHRNKCVREIFTCGQTDKYLCTQMAFILIPLTSHTGHVMFMVDRGPGCGQHTVRNHTGQSR